jgi:uncharacterized repeat protein (TIGR01451 family)
VDDPLPAGVTAGSWAFKASSAGGTVTGPSSGSGALATTVDLPTGATVAFSFTVQVDPAATGTLANTATVSPPAGTTDPNPANDSDTDTDSLTPHADLSITKAVGPGPYAIGEDVTYTLTVTNHGPSVEPQVTLEEMLPAQVTFVSASIPPTSQSAGNLTFKFGPLGAGDSTVVTLVVRADQAGTSVNQASVSGTVPDLVQSNNTASATITVMAAQTPPTVVSLQRFGFHAQPTTVVLTFSEPLDAARAQDLANYHLTLIAHGGHLRLPLRLTSAVYNATADTVTLHPAKLLPLRFKYELVVNGSTPTGVSSSSGVLLDGAGNGKPGSDYVRVFNVNILAGANRDSSPKAIHGVQHLHVGRAYATTRAPKRVQHSPPATGRSERIGAAAGKTRIRLNAEAVDAVLATKSSVHTSW